MQATVPCPPTAPSWKLPLIVLINISMISTGYSNENKPDLPDSLGAAAQRELRRVLREQSEWVKVHAAEYLLWAGHPAGVREAFQAEEEQFGLQSPYRIGIWRVLAQTATGNDEREKWVALIQDAFQDSTGTDRVHAAETLAKLRVPPSTRTVGLTRRAIESDNQVLSLYTRWAAAYYSPDSVADTQEYLLAGLTEKVSSVLFRRTGAYILRHLGDLTDSQWHRLAQVALAEPDGSDAQTYLLSAAFVKVPVAEDASDTFRKIREKLLKARNSPRKGDRTEMAMALAARGTSRELPILIALLENRNPLDAPPETSVKDPDNADVRAAAAYGILKIRERSK